MISAEQLVTAIGTRLDLVDVATEVADVKCKLSELQQDLRSPSISHELSQDLARYEEDVSSQFTPDLVFPSPAFSSSMP
jgi:hypothetical protein